MSQTESSSAGPGGGAAEVMPAFVPVDPYDWRYNQFNALQNLGYPVAFHPVTGREVSEHFHEISPGGRLSIIDSYRLRAFPQWREVKVWEPGFLPWIASPTIEPSWIANLEPEDQDALLRHPGAVLPEGIDHGRVRKVGEYVEKARSRHPQMIGSKEIFAIIIKRCLISTVQRATRLADVDPGYTRRIASQDGEARRIDLKAYEGLVASGHDPVGELHIRAWSRTITSCLARWCPTSRAGRSNLKYLWLVICRNLG